MKGQVEKNRADDSGATFASISTASFLLQGNQALLLPSPIFCLAPRIQNPCIQQTDIVCRRPIASNRRFIACCCSILDSNGSRWCSHELCRRNGEENRLFSPEKRATGRIGCSKDFKALQREHAIFGHWTVTGPGYWSDARSYRLLPFPRKFVAHTPKKSP